MYLFIYIYILKTEPADNITKTRTFYHPTLSTYTLHVPSPILFLHDQDTPNSLYSPITSS